MACLRRLSEGMGLVWVMASQSCTLPGVSSILRMYSLRKLIAWFCLAAVILAAIMPIAPGLFWLFVVPLLLFSLLVAVPTEREPESIFVL